MPERLQVRVDPASTHALEQAADLTHLRPAAAAAFSRELAEPATVNARLAAALLRPRTFSWLD